MDRSRSAVDGACGAAVARGIEVIRCSRTAFGSLLFLFASGGCAKGPGGDGRRASDKVEVGLPVPAYRTVALGGDSVSLAAQQGKVLLLNVWATWCHPCRAEIPELRALYEKYKGRGLQLVGVSVDADGADDNIRDFTKEFRMDYPIWRDPDERISAQFLIVGVPATFLVDKTGILRWRKTGPIQPGDTSLVAAIERALGT
jgi:cytochrome c biogenesis protein CcmG, thiol:disulfide interchange protein DsbE